MLIVAIISLLLNPMPHTIHHDIELEVIIDTDGAPDDLRAICMLLAMPEVNVLGITAGDGACEPAATASKVRALLRSLGKEGMPVGEGVGRIESPPPWRPFCTSFQWGEEVDIAPGETLSAAELTAESLRSAEGGVTLICLGTLTNLADALRSDPTLKEKIDRVLWYSDAVNPPAGSNYELDPESADYILSSGLKLLVFANVGDDAPAFDTEMLARVREIGTVYSDAIAAAHDQPVAWERVGSGHLKLWDDLIPAFMRNPAAFEFVDAGIGEGVHIAAGFDRDAVIAALVDILEARHVHPANIVFDSFPTDPAQFREDLRPLVGEIIKRHGEEEWRICVLTNEIHGHLGIYSIVGAKMGVYALTYLAAERDEVKVVSFAGSRPPVSCFNDGVQISTGATVGHGSLEIAPVEAAVPEAEFVSDTGMVRLRLREEYLVRIRADIKRGIELHGNLTPGYWAFVRALAIRYWLEWDRYEMFEIVAQDSKQTNKD